MAIKKSDQPNGEADRPVAASNDLEDRHKRLQVERRELEAELAAIKGKLRDAINAGDIPAIEKLSARKEALPLLFISASTAETKARNAFFLAEDEANMKILHAAQAERDRLEIKLAKRRQEVEDELTALKALLDEAETQVAGAFVAITASRDLGASGDAGFKRSLAAVTEV